MNQTEILAARLAAFHRRQAVPIRRTSSLSADPIGAFGIATLKIVSENVVQAIAFGPLGSPPTVVCRWNPLSRESGDLEAFASALCAYVQQCLDTDQLPRVWLPHQSALDTLDVTGYRYKTNQSASASLREMGMICRALSEETSFTGQQIVAVAGDLLLEHVVTGQSPTEDRHLGALLEWTIGGQDVVARAACEALQPASGILERGDDDTVETLRRTGKRGSALEQRQAVQKINKILAAGVQREWNLLIRARDAFWTLGLPPAVAPDAVAVSKERFWFSVSSGVKQKVSPHALGRLLESQEHAIEMTRHSELKADHVIQRRETRAGRVLDGVIQRIIQPRRGFRPCTITVRTSQEILRVRNDDRLSSVNGQLESIVRGVQADGGSAQTLINLELTKGFRAVASLRVGDSMCWIESHGFPLQLRQKKFKAMQDRQAPLLYQSHLPPERPITVPGNLLQIALSFRRCQ